MTSHPIQQFIITFDAGCIQGLWEQLNQALREQVRMKQGKSPQATAAIVDSQSVKTTEKKEPVRCAGSPRCSNWRGKYTASTAVS